MGVVGERLRGGVRVSGVGGDGGGGGGLLVMMGGSRYVGGVVWCLGSVEVEGRL